MGTRALVWIYDHEDKPICAVYTQYDGYPSGFGVALRDIAAVPIVNGLTNDARVANGMNCLAAQVVKGLKERAGGIYLYAPDRTAERCDYAYHLHQTPTGIPKSGEPAAVRLVVTSLIPHDQDAAVLYDGPIEDFDAAEAERVDSARFGDEGDE